MKTLATFLLALIMLAAASTDSFAQKKISFNREGKATITATVRANSKVVYYVGGKEFSDLQMTQTAGEFLKYAIKRGSEFLSSGHTTGSNIKLNSDGKSTYTIIFINDESKTRSISVSVVKSGGGSSILQD